MSEGLKVRQLLEHEGEVLLPLLQHALRRSNSSLALPDDAAVKIRKLRLAIAALNAFFFEELKKVLEAFTEAGVEAILLKGAMMMGIYPPGIRPFSDIDLMIRRGKLRQAAGILSRLGYSPRLPLRSGAEDLEAEVLYVKDGKPPVLIELHLSFKIPFFREDRMLARDVWERARRTNVGGIDALVLSPEDALLHLCLKLFTRRRAGWLRYACDVVELLHHYKDELDWEVFVKRALKYRLGLPVKYSLEKACEVFRLSIPSLASGLMQYNPGGVERQVYSMIDSNRPSAVALAHILTMPTTGLKLRRLRYALFPGREWLMRRYAVSNPKLAPLYYLLHQVEAFSSFLKLMKDVRWILVALHSTLYEKTRSW